jgi:putative nucleotidyltransferase with HDIG domain
VSTSGQRKTRIERVAALELPPNFWERVWGRMQQGDVWLRVAMCALAAVAMWIVIEGWNPPFPYRMGFTPQRDVVARVDFSELDEKATEDEQRRVANQVRYVYEQEPGELARIRTALKNVVADFAKKEKVGDVPADVWKHLSPPRMENVAEAPLEQQEADFQKMRALVDTPAKIAEFEANLAKAFSKTEQWGILKQPQRLGNVRDEDQIAGNQSEIEVHPAGKPSFPEVVRIADVTSSNAIANLQAQLKDVFGPDVGQRFIYWVNPKLAGIETLKLNRTATELKRTQAKLAILPVYQQHKRGEVDLAKQRKPIDSEDMRYLRMEYDAAMALRTTTDKVQRSLAAFGMFFALFTLSGFYIYFRHPVLLVDLRKFTRLLVLFVLAVALAIMASGDRLRAEMIPILVFGMTVGIAYNQELALLLTALLGLVVVIALGQDLASYVIILSAVATSILLLGGIRTRRRLIYVGTIAGCVVALTAIGVNVVRDYTLNLQLLNEAHRAFWWTVFASFLVTGLLPFIEKIFDVLTDLSLLEYGDPSHPLLQELVRRAPGTYNHSINVASLAEAAAEAIGARGLLVRVGAYFHDIGKMLKPGYFIENQGLAGNRHESLLPAMSTLVIIAHIKDGADLARQHHLPQPIIDFIQTHHGTTLVEYFYKRASQQSESDPNGSEVDESSYRYPGPKPQTKEEAVLMVADAAESASRALVDPTPGRIEGLVHELAMKRLLDGQFDECGLTLQELNMIEDSLIKSLTAVYHGRVKYPEQRTA